MATEKETVEEKSSKQGFEIKLDGSFTLKKENKEEKWNEYEYDDKEAFHTALASAGISKTEYKAVKNLEKAYSEAAVRKGHEFSIETLKNNKDLEAVCTSLPYAQHGSIETDLTREFAGINRLTGKPFKQSKFVVRHKEHILSGNFIRGLRDEATEQLVK